MAIAALPDFELADPWALAPDGGVQWQGAPDDETELASSAAPAPRRRPACRDNGGAGARPDRHHVAPTSAHVGQSAASAIVAAAAVISVGLLVATLP